MPRHVDLILLPQLRTHKPHEGWRTLILPLIDQWPLSDRYDFSVPWDAPENQFAVNSTIPTYSCPADLASTKTPTVTNYVLLTGTGTIFEFGKQGRLVEILDGTSGTIMAVELRGSFNNWCAPRDLDIEGFVAMFGPHGLGQSASPHPGGLNVLFADGLVRFLSFSLDSETVRALATSAGGEVVDLEELF